MTKVTAFGEVMLRLQPHGYQKIVQADDYTAYFGGSEANVAAALSQWGMDAAFVTKLPANALGDACIRNLRGWGVDTSGIVCGNGRMGIYFTEKGASQRPADILYDREFSAFSLARAEEFDFDRDFASAGWFHFSGISPALGDLPEQVTRAAVAAAKKNGLRISCDLNFRSKLWSAQKAAEVMAPLIEGIDVLVVNENQADEVFGVREPELEKRAETLAKRFSIGAVAVTKRRTISGEVNEFSALLYKDGACCGSRTYSIFMIDKIGGGDAFSAGLIYGILSGKSAQETVDYAAAAACYKHTIEGDMIAAGAADIERLVRSDGTGRLVR